MASDEMPASEANGRYFKIGGRMILPEKIFLHVLYLSWTGSLVILAVLLLRCMLHKMTKKFS